MSGSIVTRARPSETAPSKLDLVHRLARDRDALRPGFARAWRRVEQREPGERDEWAAVTLELLHVNAGPACIAAFWQLGTTEAGPWQAGLAAGRAAADICRFAGARAALACLEAQPAAVRLTGADPAGLAAWWHGLGRLAREAPALVQGLVGHIERLLADGDGIAFVDFVAAGLKATLRDNRRRVAFFTLQDKLAQGLLTRRANTGFVDCERMLGAFAAGLWGGNPRLRAGVIGPATLPARTVVASGTVVLPAVFPGIPPPRARALYRAAVAHAQAHMTVPSPRLKLLQLKPLQIALIGLIEDARVEALAIRRFSGLLQLWAAWHVARPGGPNTAVNLMARLARALLDPDYADADGFVGKGRTLFAEAAGRLDDPAFSRAIGGLLGNDLGQMRVQFNARTYAVEPAYRDDNTHLWELPDIEDDALSITVDTARGTEGGADAEPAPGDAPAAPRARDAGIDDGGAVLATYPEWDSAARVERPDWTTLRDTRPVLRARPGEDASEATLRAQIARLVRGNVIGHSARQARQETGEALDLDAAIEAAIALRGGLAPDARVYRDRRPRERDLATLIIMDVSQSTAAIGAGRQSVLDAERVALTTLAAALEARGDCYALRAFASAGREDVRLTRLKDFEEALSPTVLARIAGLAPGLSTRLGAALRHAGAELAPVRATRKLVLVLTDGEPSDIDVAAGELVEDARRAVLGLRLRGIDVFGIVMDPDRSGSGAAIFGRHNSMQVRRLQDLPTTLAGIYFRLAQR